jgi:hypothetical protein
MRMRPISFNKARSGESDRRSDHANAALHGVEIYIGDGAAVTRSFIRKRGRALIGHSPVRTQLTWCQKEGVARAIITHCGSEIVGGEEREISARLQSIAAERGVDVHRIMMG